MQSAFTSLVPDYQFNIPWQARAALTTGLICAVVGILLLNEQRVVLGAILLVIAGLVGIFRLTLFLITDPKRRRSARDRMVKSIHWTGSEEILDVGCGNGLLLLAAAKHLTAGKGRAIGIDIWNEMAGRQSAEALRRNAEIEGVANRVEVREADARRMPFDDASFDVIFASLSLHHAGGHEAIRCVISEMKRVLKPGGVILAYDLFPVMLVAARILRELGVKDIQMLSGGVLRVLRAE